MNSRVDAQPESTCRVHTTLGWVQGEHSETNGLSIFRGVPYAAPPVGKLRFQPARRADAWTAVRDVRRFGPASAQVFDPNEGLLEEFLDQPHSGTAPAWVGSEDSLTLNVWTPACDQQRRPVIVYIHGGANWLESSRLGVYHGHQLAAEGDLVVVTFNYRLGIFGFLDLTCLGPDAPSGCSRLGLGDQRLALEWVRDNILQFGGDPENITLVGESAGSMDISWHIAAGHLTGLVRRVAMMSGVASVSGFARHGDFSAHSLAYGREQARGLLDALNIHSYIDLLQLSTGELLERQARLLGDWDVLFDLDTLFYPRLERSSDCDPYAAAQAGQSAELDIMIGYTGYEMGLWLLWDDQLDQRHPEWAANALPGIPDQQRGKLAALYNREFAAKAPGVRAMHLLGDAMFVMPSFAFADLHARAGGRVWMYEFNLVPSDPRRGALHAADQMFFFGTWDSPGARELLGTPRNTNIADSWRALSRHMRQRLISFARSGDPDFEGALFWPPFTAARPTLLSFDSDSRIVPNPHQVRWDWWSREIIEPGLGQRHKVGQSE